MPYASVSALPQSVRDRLSPAQQKKWRSTFNAFYARTKDEAGAHKAANAALRKAAPYDELSDTERAHARARSYLDSEVARGNVTKPKKCSRCGGGGKLSAHHKDYSKPLDADWLCSKCHNGKHAKARETGMDSFKVTASIADFSKTSDDDQRLVWGWAYTCEIDGEQVVDFSGDVCDWREMQKCAHDFALSQNIGGEMHKTEAGRIVESVFFSPDLKKGLGCEHLPTGWFIGFRVDDDEAWTKVKDGTYRAFSIAGRGDYEEIPA